MKEILPVPNGKSYLPYQEKGIRYIIGGKGTLLADEMGLGKTVQAIGVINYLKTKLSFVNVLIIAPAGLVHNWIHELEEWSTDIIAKHVVISYHQAVKYVDTWANQRWDLLIVDESQYIKNPDTQRSQAINAIAKCADKVLALSGTPIENHPIEIWPILKIVAPKEFCDDSKAPSYIINAEQKKTHPGEGPAFWQFAKRYCDLKLVNFKVKGKLRSSYDFTGASNLDELRIRLRDTCMVRRLKKDVLSELPDKRRQLVLLKSKYKDDDLLPDLSFENYEKRVEELTANKVALEEWSKRRHAQALEKVGDAVEFIRDALDNSHKIIVFAHHKDVCKNLEELLSEFSPVIVTGETHDADRGMYVKRFQENKDCRLFIGSIRAAGVGLTLTASSHVIFVELDPTPGRMTQAEDRAHRIGQRNMVLVQHLLYDGTLCARMAKILVRKQAIITQALDG